MARRIEDITDAPKEEKVEEKHDDRIVEGFGKFMVSIGGKIVQFDTKSEATTALALEEKGAEIEEKAQAYVDARGYKDKNAVAKMRLIKDYLAFEAGNDLAK